MRSQSGPRVDQKLMRSVSLAVGRLRVGVVRAVA